MPRAKYRVASPQRAGRGGPQFPKGTDPLVAATMLRFAGYCLHIVIQKPKPGLVSFLGLGCPLSGVLCLEPSLLPLLPSGNRVIRRRQSLLFPNGLIPNVQWPRPIIASGPCQIDGYNVDLLGLP
jgi:hypothetical protein